MKQKTLVGRERRSVRPAMSKHSGVIGDLGGGVAQGGAGEAEDRGIGGDGGGGADGGGADGGGGDGGKDGG